MPSLYDNNMLLPEIKPEITEETTMNKEFASDSSDTWKTKYMEMRVKMIITMEIRVRAAHAYMNYIRHKNDISPSDTGQIYSTPNGGPNAFRSTRITIWAAISFLLV
jgi:hypothetical protein